MTMMDEVRRERMVELHGEGFRLDDLKRWGIAHINLTGQKLGRKILGTYYSNPDNKVNSLEIFRRTGLTIRRHVRRNGGLYLRIRKI